ncbi:hypothetical protein MF406_10155 [Georgenia sp. TF02-10]|uniref:hypothetical protein n=1 Tax=Georgenia sp. TF02-10 TaxID=2917725 RepID=UPI001FA775BF|nr:hypothetical protein [Georgenia sp. TF02-10]UNX53373.1 hypothetical protein MF406_10155 [Georgenia sp. TF02-10]
MLTAPLALVPDVPGGTLRVAAEAGRGMRVSGLRLAGQPLAVDTTGPATRVSTTAPVRIVTS